MKFAFTSFQESDIPLLFKWLSLPHVSEWWRELKDYKKLHEKYVKWINAADVGPYLICHSKKPIGYIQWYLYKGEEPLPENTYGFDIFIADLDYLGKGYGTKIIQQFVSEVILPMKPEKIIVDPEVGNNKAIHVYEKTGFRKTKIVDSIDATQKVKAQLMELDLD
jgi:aminoglycoside 6'-N-acetyltransferase